MVMGQHHTRDARKTLHVRVCQIVSALLMMALALQNLAGWGPPLRKRTCFSQYWSFIALGGFRSGVLEKILGHVALSCLNMSQFRCNLRLFDMMKGFDCPSLDVM